MSKRNMSHDELKKSGNDTKNPVDLTDSPRILPNHRDKWPPHVMIEEITTAHPVDDDIKMYLH